MKQGQKGERISVRRKMTRQWRKHYRQNEKIFIAPLDGTRRGWTGTNRAKDIGLFVPHYPDMNKMPHCLYQIFELMHATITRCFLSISITPSVNHRAPWTQAVLHTSPKGNWWFKGNKSRVFITRKLWGSLQKYKIKDQIFPKLQ